MSEVLRAPDEILSTLENITNIESDPSVFQPNSNFNHYVISCKGKFECPVCYKKWTSGMVTVELWWRKNKRTQEKEAFDVRVYGQECNRCDESGFVEPYIYQNYWDNIIDQFEEILKSKGVQGGGKKINKGESNSELPHDIERCQKCQLLGRPCWENICDNDTNGSEDYRNDYENDYVSYEDDYNCYYYDDYYD